MIIEQTKPHLRHELKYHVDYLQFQIIRKKLSIFLKPDPHAGPDGRYHVRSLYFDDFKNSALCEKICGTAKRKKYRLRVYNCSDDYIKFERKTKLDQYVFKESVRLTRKAADQMIAGDIGFLADTANPLLKAFYLESRNSLLRPVVLVDYYREAYVHSVGNVRITFDTGLHTNMGSTPFFDSNCFTFNVSKEQGVIMEIKFDDVLPQHIRGLFPNTIQPRCAIGKFAICRTTKILPENFT